MLHLSALAAVWWRQHSPPVTEPQRTTRRMKPRAPRSRSILLATVVVGLVVFAALAFVSPRGSLVVGVSDSVADSQAELEAAEAALAEVEGNLVEMRERFAAVKAQLDGLSAQRRTMLNQLETVQARAQQLALAAYIRGAGGDDLDTLDVSRATDAAWRRVFTEGRVDQAREAAAKLKTLRAEADDGLGALALEVTAVGRSVDDIGNDRRRAVEWLP